MLEAFFLPVEPGERFCVLHRPEGEVRASLVYVHPFAEEMNKARRTVALAARSLAAAGFAALQVDLYGCGDSSGDFADARWERWRNDVQVALAFMKERFAVPISLWGLRLGAALAADVAQRPGAVDHLLLWQPVTSGPQAFNQLLRLRLASEMLAEGAVAGGTRALAASLARGQSIEIVGYELHPDLAAAIEGIRLEDLMPAVRRVDWLEVTAVGGALRPPARRVVDAWRDVHVKQVAGESFWSTVDIVECEPLVEATRAAMETAS